MQKEVGVLTSCLEMKRLSKISASEGPLLQMRVGSRVRVKRDLNMIARLMILMMKKGLLKQELNMTSRP